MPARINFSLKKNRSDSQTAISVSLSKSLLTEIDERARELGLSRSQFLAQVARINIERGGPLTILPAPAARKDGRDAIMDFFIKALKAYEACPRKSIPEAPETLAGTPIWDCFVDELGEISLHKWNESAKEGGDIGPERAIRDWQQKHLELWAAAQNQTGE